MLSVSLVACASDLAPEAVPTAREPEPEHYGFAWVGTYEGSGAGILMGRSERSSMARLTVDFDADSVRVDECRGCVTVVLDDVFSLANVALPNPQRIDLTYDRDGQRHTLGIDRYSGGGGVANVLAARVQIQPLVGQGAPTDLSYVLERR